MADELPGLLVVLSGPSGVGKTTVAGRLLQNPGYVRSVSVTTRPIRAGEVEGSDYHFVGKDRFDSLCQRGEMIEHANVHGNYYGTPKEPLRRALGQGKVILLVIDVEGAEAAVLRGFSLARWKPRMLIIELVHTHPDLHAVSAGDAHLQRLIEEAGYSVVYKDSINTVFVADDAVLNGGIEA